MTNKKSTKRALLLSVLSLLLCVSMLIGTTYAWFTDTVTSANNIIKAGTLEIEAEYWNGTEWKTVEGASDILTGDLWEPGYTDVAYLRIKNAGSLALEYSLGVNIVSEIAGVNKAGDVFKLSDYIYFDVAKDVNGETDAYATREDAMKIATETTKISAGYSKGGELIAGSDYDYLALVAYMPTWVGNEANHNGSAPEIDLGISIFATQHTYEEDSFDATYDANAAVSFVTEANALLAENKDVTLINCNETEGVLVVPAGYTGTLTMGNVSIASVQAADTAKIVILGKVAVKATTADTSAISGTDLEISGSGNLTAVANGKNAFGIGGPAAKTVNIEGITIDYVAGGYAYETGDDLKYYKTAPEGGAAIGSNVNGAVITLKDVTVVEAIGGSKAAAIGARYHTGVTVNITDSTILYAEGGVSAAAIGGSRVSAGATESGNTINITNSTVTAQGGAYGAGIGSGYDTHCQSVQPLCTINITDSTINATGGKYAAGVGSGYHNAALAGEIKNSTVNAASGEKFYKETYTLAMDIGFGVVDPTREGQQTDSYIIYNGEKITLGDAPCMATSNEELATALNAGKSNIVLGEGTFKLTTPAAKNLTISGQGDKTVLDFTTATNANGASITFEDLKIVGQNQNNMSGYGIQHTTGDIVYKNCTLENAITNEYYGTVSYEDCTFTGTYYIATYAVKSATFENCVFDRTDSRAILVYSHGDNPLSVVVKDCEFKAAAKGHTWSGDWTAAIEVDTTNIKTAGTTVTIEGCTYDSNYSALHRDKSAAGATPAVIIVK